MFEGVFLIFCFLVIGFLLKKAKKDYSDVLIAFCITVAFPALIFQKIYPLELSARDSLVVLLAAFSIFFGFFAGYLLSNALRLHKKSAAVVIMASGLGNTSFVGFPFVEAMYGKDALLYALLFDQFGSFLFLALFGSSLAAWGAGKDSSVKKLFASIFLFPPFLAILVSLALKPFALPSVLLLGADKLAAVLLPLVSIAVGMKIDLAHIREKFRLTTAILTVKMGAVPLFTAVLIAALGLSGVSFEVALIESAMPPMVMVAVFAARYGLDEKLAVSAVALGVLISFVSIPLIGLFYNPL